MVVCFWWIGHGRKIIMTPSAIIRFTERQRCDCQSFCNVSADAAEKLGPWAEIHFLMERLYAHELGVKRSDEHARRLRGY